MEFTVADAAAMKQVAREKIAPFLRPGDVVILTGGLGAGKTTLTQGLGDALGVRGPVASPTFIIARTHPNEGTGPALIHVDAYRLNTLAELDDLDLDATVDTSVTVVEWGEELGTALAQSYLHVRIDRDYHAPIDMADPAGGMRMVHVSGHGPRWQGTDYAPQET